jgi:hypothetical protein
MRLKDPINWRNQVLRLEEDIIMTRKILHYLEKIQHKTEVPKEFQKKKVQTTKIKKKRNLNPHKIIFLNPIAMIRSQKNMTLKKFRMKINKKILTF